MNKKLVIPVVAFGVLAASLVAATQISAQETPAMQTIVQKIAQKFGLNETDVQGVFDEFSTEKKAQMQAMLEQKLTQAVTDGKITEPQKQAILTKFSEMKNQKLDLQNWKNKTVEEKRAAMEAKHAEMEKWATQNGLSWTMFHELLGGKGFGKGVRGMMWK